MIASIAMSAARHFTHSEGASFSAADASARLACMMLRGGDDLGRKMRFTSRRATPAAAPPMSATPPTL